jgi:hypothetical protein
MSKAGSENELYEQLAQYLSLQHPKLKGLWRFDLAGVWTPSHQARNLYGRLNSPGWPDFLLAVPVFYPSHVVVGGLFLEIKRDGTRLKKRDGSWASDHIAEQAATLTRLQAEGYVGQFAVGFGECVSLIESYLTPAKAFDVHEGREDSLDDEAPF